MPAKKKNKRSAQTAADGTAKGRRLGLVVSFVLASASMFFLGVLVGRGTAPVQFDIEALQKELLALRQTVEAESRRDVTVSMDPENAAPADDLRFYEVLKSTAGAPSTDPMHKNLADYTPPPAAVKPPVPPPAAVKPPVQPPAAAAAPAEAQKPPKPESAPVRLTVQVASVRESRVAGQMVERLRKKGYPAFSFATRVPGKGLWYRVRIGQYDDRHLAEQVLERLKGDNLSGTVVKRQ